jgi:DmsE family decaheme c-type cytochrome
MEKHFSATAPAASGPVRAGFLGVLCLAATTGWAQQAQPEPAAKPDYIGSEMCAVCHEDIAKVFQKTRHQAIEADKRRGWEGRACESCHGPGSKHAEAAAATDIINPVKLRVLDEITSCLVCHKNQMAPTGKIAGGHANDQVACSQCHTVHPVPGKMLADRRKPQVNEQCGSCHQGVRSAFARPQAHRVNEGAMSCVDCHNPHKQVAAPAQRVSFGNEPSCLSCHANLRGPFVFEHAPVRLEGCGACHVPHGSPNPKMLTRHEAANVCLECHADIGVISGRANALGGPPPAFHDLRTARFRNCTTCHRKIHGSHADRSLQR